MKTSWLISSCWKQFGNRNVQHGEALSPDWPAMKKHEILSSQSRATLFGPPSDVTSIVRHYTFSMEDLALIRQRLRDANRLGFAAHLAYLRYPGRVRHCQLKRFCLRFADSEPGRGTYFQ